MLSTCLRVTSLRLGSRATLTGAGEPGDPRLPWSVVPVTHWYRAMSTPPPHHRIVMPSLSTGCGMRFIAVLQTVTTRKQVYDRSRCNVAEADDAVVGSSRTFGGTSYRLSLPVVIGRRALATSLSYHLETGTNQLRELITLKKMLITAFLSGTNTDEHLTKFGKACPRGTYRDA